ncbi:MAG: DUF2845 domain-containing protein [Woeseia sp.]
MKKQLTVWALAACLMATASSAMGPMRCKGKLIEPGVPMAYVLQKCGPPKHRVIETGPVRSRSVSGFARLSGTFFSEQWIYERGFGRFPAILIFDHGTLKRIEYLPERSGHAR